MPCARCGRDLVAGGSICAPCLAKSPTTIPNSASKDSNPSCPAPNRGLTAENDKGHHSVEETKIMRLSSLGRHKKGQQSDSSSLSVQPDQPVQVSKLAGESSKTPGLIGRDAELLTLHGAWARVNEAKNLGLVTVAGPLGSGKSVLLKDFLKSCKPRPGKVFRAAFEENVQGGNDFSPLAAMLRKSLGLELSWAPSRARDALISTLSSSFGDDELIEQAHMVGHFIGIPFPGSFVREALRNSPNLFLLRSYRAFARALACVADEEDGPSILVLEDLHNARDKALELVRFLCRHLANQSILVLASVRQEDEVDDNSPLQVMGLNSFAAGSGDDLGDESSSSPAGDPPPEIVTKLAASMQTVMLEGVGGKVLERVINIHLEPLRSDHIGRIMARFMGGEVPPKEVVELVAMRAKGNPLAVERLANLMIDQGVLVPSDVGWKIDPIRLSSVELPRDMEGLAHARLGRLCPEELRLMETASVQGCLFWRGALDACLIATTDCDEDPFDDKARHESTRKLLMGLLVKGVIDANSSSVFPDEEQFSFREPLERGLLYSPIKGVKKKRLHRVVARWMEENLVSVRGDTPITEWIANHNECAGEPRRAAHFFLLAARCARKILHHEHSISLYEKALEHLGDEESGEAIAVGRELGELLLLTGEPKAAFIQFKEVRRVAAVLGNRAIGGLATKEMGRCCQAEGDYERALNFLRRAQELLEEVNDLSGVASCLDDIGTVLLEWGCSGSSELAQAHFERSLQIRRKTGQDHNLALSFHNMGRIMLVLGKTDDAHAYFEEAVLMRRQQNDQIGLVSSLNAMAITYHDKNNLEKARSLYKEALSIAQQIGDRASRGKILNNLGETYLDDGDLEEAQELLCEALDLSSAVGDKRVMVDEYINLSRVFQKQGEHDRAFSSCQEALDLVAQMEGSEGYGPALRRMGELLSETLYTEEGGLNDTLAKDCFERAIAVCESSGNEVELARSYEALGKYLFESGDESQATHFFNKANEITGRYL